MSGGTTTVKKAKFLFYDPEASETGLLAAAVATDITSVFMNVRDWKKKEDMRND